MTDQQMLALLEEKIKEAAPTFELRFKDESTFMKILGKALFFNKGFMDGFITTIGTKVYWPTRERYENNPRASFITLAHESVHIMDYIKSPVRFVLGYLFPQILAAFALLSVLAFFSPWFLLCLLFLLCLAPIPSPGRKTAEIRGYGMSAKTRIWLFGSISPETISWYVHQFTGSSYYFMWPFANSIRKEMKPWVDPLNTECLNESVYKTVHDIIKE